MNDSEQPTPISDAATLDAMEAYVLKSDRVVPLKVARAIEQKLIEVQTTNEELKADKERLNWLEVEGRKHGCNLNLDWGEDLTIRSAIDLARKTV